MKNKIFNIYVNNVCNLFGIKHKAIFKKTKTRDIVDARHLLYYVCSIRPMRIVHIQEYMANKGYNVAHSSIHHGIGQMKEKLKVDIDYIEAVAEVTKEYNEV
mgnify:CR=1 FL=1|tara:strand:- start:672 stop:977 length:306 start_codon:yes stop_codon:yes gene_type:complete